MPILRIKPHMLEPIPTFKVPEVHEAKGEYPTLDNRLQNIDAKTVNGYIPVNKEGDEITGSLSIGGNLKISGDVVLDERISSIANTRTQGNFGVNIVLANSNDIYASTEEDDSIIVQHAPKNNGNYLVYIYFRVLNGESKINIKIGYEDSGGYVYQEIINNELYEVGSYCLPAVFINAMLGSPIVVRATNEIENSLLVSAAIVGL